MRALFISLILLVLDILTSLGQVPRYTLDTDPNFQKALKEIKYPDIQSLVKKTTFVFVSFTINQQGKITNIKYLNENEVDTPFVSEVSRVFWHFPSQKPIYVGEYILPIAFEKEVMQVEKRNSSIQEELLAYTRIYERVSRSLRPVSLLSEVFVTAHN